MNGGDRSGNRAPAQTGPNVLAHGHIAGIAQHLTLLVGNDSLAAAPPGQRANGMGSLHHPDELAAMRLQLLLHGTLTAQG